MEDSWTRRDKKVAVRSKHKKMGGKFKQKEERDKGKGKQRKVFNQIRRIRSGDDMFDETEGEDNGAQSNA